MVRVGRMNRVYVDPRAVERYLCSRRKKLRAMRWTDVCEQKMKLPFGEESLIEESEYLTELYWWKDSDCEFE
jgi:hypothetical protein